MVTLATGFRNPFVFKKELVWRPSPSTASGVNKTPGNDVAPEHALIRP
jgi:hypothetical protein